MMRLRGIGFFRELSKDLSDGPSLREALSDTPQPDEEKIVAYLNKGVGLIGYGAYISDVLNPAINGLTASICTDGVYAWRRDLAYYVTTYHVTLPPDFVAHMRANDWTLPDKDSMDRSDFHIE